jgi:hypothetical protein
MTGLPISVTHQPLAAVLTQIAKREHATLDQIAGRFLVAGLVAERRRIVAARSERAGIEPTAIVVPDFCSEAFLRQIWGDQWEIGWWLASCALPEPT